MEKPRTLPKSLINKVRKNPQNYGIACKGINSLDYEEYSDEEINNMYLGIYKADKMLLTDGDYLICLCDVEQVLCILSDIACLKKPLYDYHSIRDIRTFYIEDYFVITRKEINGTTKHKITRYLFKVGAIKQGKNKYSKLYSCRNLYRELQPFNEGLFPKDLYYPIKKYINGFFFEDEYRISNFKVESTVVIGLP